MGKNFTDLEQIWFHKFYLTLVYIIKLKLIYDYSKLDLGFLFSPYGLSSLSLRAIIYCFDLVSFSMQAPRSTGKTGGKRETFSQHLRGSVYYGWVLYLQARAEFTHFLFVTIMWYLFDMPPYFTF